ncbi:MAG: cyclic nucleotide-binding domain-containing protein [Acidobacteria bacterium]|nr:cyclic nucleotide-binding domain-containing protein [Acidobacteriota bacterium]MCW5967365.1 cyclic nucleotide-binding domain-containing protein [Blastocatellales bacterium]
MPKETTSRRAVLSAIEQINAISDLTAKHDGHFNHELDLEVSVYGRNYNGKRVGPYIRMFEYAPGEEIIHEGDWGGNTFYIVVDGAADVYIRTPQGEQKVSTLTSGRQFGEMSVLAGVPRAATVRSSADNPVRILEVQRPALRLLRKLDKFGQLLDSNYRLHGRSATLQDLCEPTQLAPEVEKYLETISEFRVFSKNHVLFHAGEPIRRVYVIRYGWARLASGEGANVNERFVGQMTVLGLEAITRDQAWSETCTLMGRAEVLEISISKLRQNPEVRELLRSNWESVSASTNKTDSARALPVVQTQRQLIETGVVDATNLLLMDMELCVRCGNCSLACHSMHGTSRLLRRGIHVARYNGKTLDSGFQSLLSPSVCLHCQDPECLTGCPTGAIGRQPGGQVDIDPKTCIGCGDCATQCPYNAISMIPRRKKDVEPARTGWKSWFSLKTDPLPPAVEQTEDLLASKCNLCNGTTLNPKEAKRPAYSCEENCPTGALLRVDPHKYFSEIQNIKSVVARDRTHAIARHTSHKDPGKRLMHAAGIASTLALTVLTILGLVRYGLETPLISTWFNIRWMTGIVGLLAIVGVMAYPWRRKIYRKRRGPLRYWMLAHAYLGVIGGIVLLLHGGTDSGGILTTALMISFDLVIATGLFGIACYYLVPRLMTRIEEHPLLMDDLIGRREELKAEIGDKLANAGTTVRNLVAGKIAPHFLSNGYLIGQYTKRAKLADDIASGRRKFSGDAESLSRGDRETVESIIADLATQRRAEALIYLHRLLKSWLPPHVITTSFMLALMIVHIVQVTYFLAR